MLWFGPNVEALAAKRDHEGLGKLLHHKDISIRQASAQALLRLLRNSNRNDRELILRRFREGHNDKDIIAFLMGEIEKLPIYTQDAYTGNLVVAALHAGAVSELIAFNKRIAPVLSDGELGGRWRENQLNESISLNLIGYALSRKFGIKELVDIIPYTVSAASQDTFAIEKVLKQAETLPLPRENIMGIRERIDRLPPNIGGLENYVKSKLAPILLSKLKEAEQVLNEQ